jgi:3-oxoacyl-[acyl-carrier protein] reductase
MDLGLTGATAVVIGASRGIGRATARLLAEEGAKVAIVARSIKGLAKTDALLRDAGCTDVMALEADICNSKQVDAVFEKIGMHWGSLNILINNAANSLATQGLFEDISDENWHSAFDTLTISYARTIRAALPLMRKAKWGRIVNVSSASTQDHSPMLGAFNVAKAAVTSLSKHLSRTLGPDNILVNTMSPGSIMVSGGNWGDAMNQQFIDRGLDPTNPYHATKIQLELYGTTPEFIGRSGLVEEYAAALVFMASQRNGYMTGANINVDGGSNFV